MRRLAALTVAVALALPAGVALAGETADYRDDFGSGDYSGNDGSLEFSAAWSEFGDSGGPWSGNVHVGQEYCSNNDCLHIEGGEGLDPGLVLTSFGVSRAADLSLFESAELSFDIQVVPQIGLLEATNADLWVQVYDGSQWHSLKEYDLSQATDHHKTISVSEHLGSGFKVRFKVPDASEAGLGGLELFYNGHAIIDRVEINGHLRQTKTTTPSTSSTTTTTRPRSSNSLVSTQTSTSSTTLPTTTIPNSPSTSDPRSTVNASPDLSGNGRVESDGGTTTTTVPGSTTTTEGVTAVVPPTSPPGGGLRDPGVGLMTDYESGMMGQTDAGGVEVLGAEFDADFSMAVELVEAARLWIALLALVIGAAFIGSLDRSRSQKEVR